MCAIDLPDPRLRDRVIAMLREAIEVLRTSILEPRDHLHINLVRAFAARSGSA
jgi:hypothetical protein